ncbi:MAG: foldase protein PrsA [Bacillota bacterium]
MLQKRKKKIYLVLLVLIIVSAIAMGNACSNEVVAVVDGESISKDDLYDALVKQNGKQTLDSLITDRIIDKEAKKNKISISEKEIQEELDNLIVQNGGQTLFDQTLKAYNLTLDDVKKDIGKNMKLEKLLQKEVSVSEEEMKSYFQKNKESFNQQEQVQVRHILVDDEATAKEVKEKLDAGVDFAELAKKYSTDSGTKDAGGELGFISKGQMVAEFEEAAFSLKVGQTSEPIKSDYGYHIINVKDKKEAKAANYEDAKAEIKEILLDQKIQTEYNSWLDKKYKEYKVENFLEKGNDEKEE